MSALWLMLLALDLWPPMSLPTTLDILLLWADPLWNTLDYIFHCFALKIVEHSSDRRMGWAGGQMVCGGQVGYVCLTGSLL